MSQERIDEWARKFREELAGSSDPVKGAIAEAIIDGARETGANKKLSGYDISHMTRAIFAALDPELTRLRRIKAQARLMFTGDALNCKAYTAAHKEMLALLGDSD